MTKTESAVERIDAALVKLEMAFVASDVSEKEGEKAPAATVVDSERKRLEAEVQEAFQVRRVKPGTDLASQIDAGAGRHPAAAVQQVKDVRLQGVEQAAVAGVGEVELVPGGAPGVGVLQQVEEIAALAAEAREQGVAVFEVLVFAGPARGLEAPPQRLHILIRVEIEQRRQLITPHRRPELGELL